ncbi:hypothetical protein BGZ83_008566 [Gryganskiella cystojenkinii]|nr:hypothetical protein BGZ83_008566 [Gryganskiella cystojenkinii]
MSSESEILLSETIKDLENVRQLLQKVVLMAPKAFLGPDLFIRLECLELYDPDQQVCVQGLRRERERLLQSRQTLSVLVESNRLQAQHREQSAGRDGGSNRELSSVSVAFAAALHDLSQERISRIRELDLMLQEFQSTIDKVIQTPLSTWGPLYHNKPLIKPLFDESRSKFLSNLYRELERIRPLRDSLAMEHQRLQVKSLLTQMKCMANLQPSS